MQEMCETGRGRTEKVKRNYWVITEPHRGKQLPPRAWGTKETGLEPKNLRKGPVELGSRPPRRQGGMVCWCWCPRGGWWGWCCWSSETAVSDLRFLNRSTKPRYFLMLATKFLKCQILLWRQYSSKKLKMELSYDQARLLLDIDPK